MSIAHFGMLCLLTALIWIVCHQWQKLNQSLRIRRHTAQWHLLQCLDYLGERSTQSLKEFLDQQQIPCEHWELQDILNQWAERGFVAPRSDRGEVFWTLTQQGVQATEQEMIE